MNKYTILLLLALAGASLSANAQRTADTTLMIYDTPRVARGTNPPATHRAAGSGAARKVICAPLAKAAKDSLIKNIRTIFQRINGDSTLKAVSLTPDELEEAIGGSPDNGADVTGYFKKDTLYKLYISVGLSFGPKDYEYYYDKGEIVFVYEKDRHFLVKHGDPDKDEGGLDHEHLVLGFEGRFYFDKGKPIAKLVKRYDDFMAEEISPAYIDELLEVSPYVDRLRKHVRKKK